MRRAALAVALLAFVGCDWMSPTQIVNIDQVQDTQPTETIPGGGDTGGAATGLRAERAACTNGDSCSSFRLFWSAGSAPFDSVSTRASDGLVHAQRLNGSGLDLVDPGPAGDGAGTWSVTLNGAGPVTVELDS